MLIRLFRREKIYMAHRQHGFQKLLRQGWSHRRVAVLYNGIVVMWLFPLAFLASFYDDFSFFIAVIAYLPLFAILLYLRAGTEKPAPAWLAQVADMSKP